MDRWGQSGAGIVNEARARDGLPALSTSFERGEVVDIPHDFSVATRRGEIVVFWTDLIRCEGYRVENTSFLVTDDRLAGLWFTGLADADIKLFESHAVCA